LADDADQHLPDDDYRNLPDDYQPAPSALKLQMKEVKLEAGAATPPNQETLF